jgi:SNF2 family DNA or RNA helicase
MCRQNINSDDTILVKSITEINNSPKMHKIIELISMSAKKFIIFTQFNILDKIKLYLTNNDIISSTFNEYTIDTQVLLLSSAQNAEGIDLSTFDNIIIFEPFEDHIYSNEIEKQLVGRIHRIGRKDIVNVYRFITSGTIEEDIYAKINI